ncbi:MAG: hypothetical protein EXS05_04660 [Planctomycetaceae bacterium]|nr:hypothetical protein [Planctomycetaceae bacterium]
MSTADLETIERVLGRMTLAEKRELIERVARDLRKSESVGPAEQKKNLRVLRTELLALPVQNPADGFSNVDHDLAIYGAEK